jgi:hypothetical protein
MNADLYFIGGASSGTLSVLFTATTSQAFLHFRGTANRVRFDNISVREVVLDRSYKSRGATLNGTLTKAQLASGTSLVGYSGFSAANYLREPYSTDLDFGTGEWSASAWVNVPVSHRKNLLQRTEEFNNSTYWTNASVNITANAAVSPIGTTTAELFTPAASGGDHGVYVLISSGVAKVLSVYAKQGPGNYKLALHPGGNSNRAVFNLLTGAVDANDSFQSATLVDEGNGWFRCSLTVSGDATYIKIYVADASNNVNYTGDGSSGIYVWGAQLEIGSVTTAYQAVVDGSELTFPVLDRAHSSGARVRLSLNGLGRLSAEAFDGTTARTVTTSAAYNRAQWLRAEACYTLDGTLSIRVNGREVAATRGTPLLTLNNSSAVLTIGNSYALDAPFPGSIALLKLGATVPTYEQSQFMYEQEKQLFRAGAQSVLPDSGSIVDMAYDDATDRWVAVSGTNESYWTGLVRNSVTPVPAGSFTRIVAGSGVELAARSTTNPGVDVSIPAYGLREELVKRAEAAARLSRELAVYDYVGGFTANTTSGSTAITNASTITYPASYIGARISGTGIPANTTIVAVSGSTLYLSAAATATATGVSISFIDFELPVGMEAKTVMVAGSVKQEGATKDFTRLYDGFIETIRFGVAPGVTAWVQIQATRGTMQ